jgi:hypothetical protein
MIARGDLPNQLQFLLSHPNILKAGRLVDADLKFLEAACQPRTPFVGGVELANMPKTVVLFLQPDAAWPTFVLLFWVNA